MPSTAARPSESSNHLQAIHARAFTVAAAAAAAEGPEDLDDVSAHRRAGAAVDAGRAGRDALLTCCPEACSTLPFKRRAGRDALVDEAALSCAGSGRAT